MLSRKLVSHIYDLLFFIIVQGIIFRIVEGIMVSKELSLFYTFSFVIPLFIIFNFLLFGLFAHINTATIGHYFEKLRIVPTKGNLTILRLFLRNTLSLVVYYPLMGFLVDSNSIFNILREQNELDLFFSELNYVLLLFAILVILINACLNLYLYFKFDQSIVDRIFDTRVEMRKRKEVSYEDFSKYSKTNNN